MPIEDQDFLKDRLNYALVVSGTHDDIHRLKQVVAKIDIQVVFQQMSYGELTIVKGSKHEQQ